MFTLFYTPKTCALATHIALIDAGADYTLKRIDFAKGEQRAPEFLAVNPKGRVPALATPQGILTETPAVLAYLAQTHPKANLAPSDPFAFARLQAFTVFIASTLHVAHAHGPRGNRWTDDPAAQAALKSYVPTSMTAAFKLVEDTMLEGPFVMGDSYTIADPYLFTMSTWIEVDGVDTTQIPRVMAHRQMMSERPSVIRALAEEA
ncbi:MAG: glutathione S-transferase N-terminal domain-containing protein [Tabrizicola sp.]|jgi:glutathione S-transferase|nr:glutathione S-transferase N-terminal domain-containing protein [Tabrizicola sp.]